MNENTISENQAARIEYLEENKRFTRNAMEIALSLGDFQKQIHKQATQEQVFEEIQNRICKLIPFDITAFYLVDQETADLVLSRCAPRDQTGFVEDQVAFLIDKGFMAWAIREPRGVSMHSEDHKYTIFLHVIATYSRIRGMFVGIFSQPQKKIQDISYDLTSIVLRNAANALESIEYYSLLDKQGLLLKKAHDDLEMRVRERTAALTEANLKLQKEVEERKAAEKSKEILLKEIHHRVKNNMQIILSLLKMQARQNLSAKGRDESLGKSFKDSQDRIFSMALVHEQLYQSKNLSSIDFKGYVKKLVRNLRTTFDRSNPNMDIRIDIRDVFIDIDLAIPCGLIINELVSNAFKYAFPGEAPGTLRIAMHTEDDMVFLDIEDNGTGLPGDVDPATTPTLGIKLVQNLVSHQLAGELTISRDKGTAFNIRFSRPPKALS
ncbi:MAG TPA: hypothetical protein DHV36_16765 [Desulfobacteraceae bacterium]|nr:hypothetical protein [Desulfobacteraceae bacterium]